MERETKSERIEKEHAEMLKMLKVAENHIMDLCDEQNGPPLHKDREYWREAFGNCLDTHKSIEMLIKRVEGEK